MDKSHKLSLDILRILAAFSVVMLHVSSRFMMVSKVNDAYFCAANFFDSINRFGVPVFVMISGALFLSPERENDAKRLWLHNILRILIVYIIWSYGYYVYQSVYLWNFDFWNQGIVRTVTGIAYATDHLWYLGMLIGLYAISPVLNSWVKKASKQNIEYFLFVFIVFSIIKSTITVLLDSSLVSKISETFSFVELSGYIGYFVFGYYLIHYGLSRRLKILVYLSVPMDMVFNYLISFKMSEEYGYYNPGVYDSFGLFTFLEVTALFLFITEMCKKSQVNNLVRRCIKNVSRDTFGIYLMHLCLLDFLMSLGLFDNRNPLLWEIPIAIGVFVVSMLVSAILRRLPYVGRYIC